MRINTNIAALNTFNQYSINNNAANKSMEKLSSGQRINSASDDAAGLAISEKMRSQIRGLDQASRNSQDGISMVQTAEGALEETEEIVQRMRELSVQAASGTYTADDQASIQLEIDELALEITRISTDTEFNGTVLLDGNFSASIQVGADSGQSITIAVGTAMDAGTLTVGALDMTAAGAAIDSCDAAIKTVSDMRATLGAKQNRLEHTINNLSTSSENLTASESRIRDVDIAKEMMIYTTKNVLQQSAQAMLSQANTKPEGVLQLLR